MTRRITPDKVRDMAMRRGLQIRVAKLGGWYVTLSGLDTPLYCSHLFGKIREFITKQPRLLKMDD